MSSAIISAPSRMASTRQGFAALALFVLACLSAPAQCQNGAEWDRARADLKASAPGAIAPAIARWRQLVGTENQGFEAYAGFVLAWPGFPQEEALRKAAEHSLALENVDPARIVALFDRFPPLTNPARAAYALALSAQGRERDAATIARAAWRGGVMSDAAEAAILARWGRHFPAEDHDSRLEALLWDGATAQATRALSRASASRLPAARARIAIQQGLLADPVTTPVPAAPPISSPTPNSSPADPISLLPTPSTASPQASPEATPEAPIASELLRDPGYLVDRARFLLRHGRGADAATLLASRPALARPALDPRRWIALNLVIARTAPPAEAARIAATALEGFPPDADIPQQNFAIRDDVTSLMWLGATSALFQLRDAPTAARLFALYGSAARTPMTRSKGFYWAGRAQAAAGAQSEATRLFTSAAQYPNQYYGQLALERLALPLPPLHDSAHPQPTDAQRADFAQRPITQAVREVARDTDWPTTIRFFREIANQAKTETDFVLVADLAKSLGRRDLAVIAGQAVENAGLPNFRDLAFPLVPVPEGANWTFVHAIARQESQFSQNAISRTSARGLMQLMPTTAAEVARKNGLPVSTAALIEDPLYNLALGNAYFSHLLTSYRGSYPLAVAAYNAGPGNVNRWLASRGDPRVDGHWVEWIEDIPISETRGYVIHVLENAVTYEAMNPDRAAYKGPNPLSHYLGKDQPG